jgi:hypothetical protein
MEGTQLHGVRRAAEAEAEADRLPPRGSATLGEATQ